MASIQSPPREARLSTRKRAVAATSSRPESASAAVAPATHGFKGAKTASSSSGSVGKNSSGYDSNSEGRWARITWSHRA